MALVTDDIAVRNDVEHRWRGMKGRRPGISARKSIKLSARMAGREGRRGPGVLKNRHGISGSVGGHDASAARVIGGRRTTKLPGACLP